MTGTLIFDWDGTLHDTASLYGGAFRAAYDTLVQAGHMPPRYYSDEELSAYLGMNGPDMWHSFAPQLPEPVWRAASAVVTSEMARRVREGQAVLYPGTEQTLARLRDMGYHMVILSNCVHGYLQAHREVFRLDRFFEGYYACQDYGFAPKEEIFSDIAAKHPGDFVMIGDRASDMKVGQTHGLKTVFCRYGFGKEEEGAGAWAAADSITQLPDILA